MLNLYVPLKLRELMDLDTSRSDKYLGISFLYKILNAVNSISCMRLTFRVTRLFLFNISSSAIVVNGPETWISKLFQSYAKYRLQ